MKSDTEKKLKALLKRAGNDKPAGDFTDVVMQIIEADAARENVLKSLLKRQPVEGPSFDFTANVMRQVGARQKPLVVNPVIPKKAWYVIGTFFTLCLIAAFWAGKANSQAIADGGSKITGLVNHLQAISPAVALSMVLVAILLIGDYWFSRRKKALDNSF